MTDVEDVSCRADEIDTRSNAGLVRPMAKGGWGMMSRRTTEAAPAATPRHVHELLEPYHSVTYLAREPVSSFAQLGYAGPWSSYFAIRAAPLGNVRPAVVAAVFHHFCPDMVRSAVEGLWTVAKPREALLVRQNAVDVALRRLLGELVEAPETAEAARLIRVAADAVTRLARPLGAANAEIPEPFEPHLSLWQSATTLREARCDGHGIALAAAGLDGVEALALYAAAGGERRASIQPRRGWSDDEWEAGVTRLAGRGLLTADGALTPAGGDLHREVEDRTDRLAADPWIALGPARTERLARLVRPLTAAVTAGLPRGAVGVTGAPPDTADRRLVTGRDRSFRRADDRPLSVPPAANTESRPA
jgi:hypothetical protein